MTKLQIKDITKEDMDGTKISITYSKTVNIEFASSFFKPFGPMTEDFIKAETRIAFEKKARELLMDVIKEVEDTTEVEWGEL